jgi:hypothetical protein
MPARRTQERIQSATPSKRELPVRTAMRITQKNGQRYLAHRRRPRLSLHELFAGESPMQHQDSAQGGEHLVAVQLTAKY